jgi:ABC-type Fe3+/spermidine/putrescine transport system ATPase subunit
LTKSFGRTLALDRATFSVEKGELCAILGPSGCGKTTLLRAIAGFSDADSGQIRIAGMSLRDVEPHQRNIGVVFQNYALFPHLSVFDNVAYGLRSRRIPRAEIYRRVAEALERVRLAGLEKRRPHELSGGQKQRVGLARALVIEPSVLLMDEPLSNLDTQLRCQLRRDIRLLQRELGITTLYVTHDQEEALAIADGLVVMKQGVILQAGSPRDVYREPCHLFVAEFLGDNCRLAGRIECTDRQPYIRLGCGARISAPRSGAVGAEVVAVIRSEHWRLFEPNSDAADDELSIPAKPIFSAFHGSHLRVELAVTGAEEPIAIHLPADEDVDLGSQIELRCARSVISFYAHNDGRRLI